MAHEEDALEHERGFVGLTPAPRHRRRPCAEPGPPPHRGHHRQGSAAMKPRRPHRLTLFWTSPSRAIWAVAAYMLIWPIDRGHLQSTSATTTSSSVWHRTRDAGGRHRRDPLVEGRHERPRSSSSRGTRRGVVTRTREGAVEVFHPGQRRVRRASLPPSADRDRRSSPRSCPPPPGTVWRPRVASPMEPIATRSPSATP